MMTICTSLLGALGSFYAAFGAFRLGFRIDFVLALGAAALLVQAMSLQPSSDRIEA